jgi:hypothetical protein
MKSARENCIQDVRIVLEKITFRKEFGDVAIFCLLHPQGTLLYLITALSKTTTPLVHSQKI